MNPLDKPSQYSPLTLAFLGDAVYSLLVRQHILEAHGSMPSGKLHRLSVRYVCAEAQAKLYDEIEALLSEDEHAILKRGRNATGISPPRHTDLTHYSKATAIEALFGYLQLCGRAERIRELGERVFTEDEQPR